MLPSGASMVTDNNTTVVVVLIRFLQVDILRDGNEAQWDKQENQCNHKLDAHDFIVCTIDSGSLNRTHEVCRTGYDEVVPDGSNFGSVGVGKVEC